MQEPNTIITFTGSEEYKVFAKRCKQAKHYHMVYAWCRGLLWLYAGHSTKGRQRFWPVHGYINVKEKVQPGDCIKIWVEPITGIINYEDFLIRAYQPRWNILGTNKNSLDVLQEFL